MGANLELPRVLERIRKLRIEPLHDLREFVLLPVSRDLLDDRWQGLHRRHADGDARRGRGFGCGGWRLIGLGQC